MFVEGQTGCLINSYFLSHVSKSGKRSCRPKGSVLGGT